MSDTNEQRDPVEAAKHLLNHPGWREPFGSDARKVVMALCDEVDRLRGEQGAIRSSVDKLVNSDFVCSRCGSPKK